MEFSNEVSDLFSNVQNLGADTIGRAFEAASHAVASSPIVGDRNFRMTYNENDVPWSQRFKLLGNASHDFTAYKVGATSIIEEHCIEPQFENSVKKLK